MAFSIYTPTPTKLTTLQTPDDSELETSGIAASNTPDEELADGIAYLNGREPGVHSWSFDNGVAQFTAITQDVSWEDPSSGGYIDITGCAVGDTIVVHAHFMVTNDENTTTGHQMRVAAVDDYGGTPTTTAVSGARAYAGVDTGTYVGLAVNGEHTVTAAGTTRIKLQGLVESSGDTMRWVAAGGIVAKHYPGGV
jgi:hypothetical protein